MTAVDISGASARGPRERGRPRSALVNVTLRTGPGVLAIVGAPRDGTSLLFDVLDATSRTREGMVTVLGGAPEKARDRVARVSLDASLPEALRVEEICDLAADLRGEPRRPARERLGVLGVADMAGRRVRTLSLAERRTVALAIALSSSKVEVLLVEEPLLVLEPVAPRLVIDALRARGATATVIATTASVQDAALLADHLGVLTAGAYAPIAREDAHVGLGEAAASMRVVVAPSGRDAGAASLLAALSGDDAVAHVEAASFASPSGGAVVAVWGPALVPLSMAVTRAIARARVDVELVEPSAQSLASIRIAMAARAASPPPGSLPPRPGSIPPGGPSSARPSAGSAPASVRPASTPTSGGGA